MSNLNYCEYCCGTIHFDDDRKIFPDDLPDDIPDLGYDTMAYHRWCFEDVVDDERREIAAKHGDG